MHVSKGIEKRDIHVHIRCLVDCKLLPLQLHLDVNEIGTAAKRLGSLGSQPHAAPFDAALQTIELVEKSPHGFLDGIRGRQMPELNLDSSSVHDLDGYKTEVQQRSGINAS